MKFRMVRPELVVIVLLVLQVYLLDNNGYGWMTKDVNYIAYFLIAYEVIHLWVSKRLTKDYELDLS